jgi:hypothetical protein
VPTHIARICGDIDDDITFNLVGSVAAIAKDYLEFPVSIKFFAALSTVHLRPLSFLRAKQYMQYVPLLSFMISLSICFSPRYIPHILQRECLRNSLPHT